LNQLLLFFLKPLLYIYLDHSSWREGEMAHLEKVLRKLQPTDILHTSDFLF